MKPNNQQLLDIPEDILKELLISKSKFLGQLVHNLKNPIGSGLSFSEMMMEDIDSYTPEKLKRHLSIIKGSCEAALTQLEVLMIESKLETNTLDLFLQESLFSTLIKNCIEQNQKSIAKNNLQIQLHLLNDEPYINFDKKLVNLVLQSVFQFYIQNTSNANIHIRLTKQDGFLNFSILNDDCCKCQDKYEEMVVNSTIQNKQVFSSSVNKFLGIQSIIEIAKLHQGNLSYTLTEKDSIKFELNLPL